MAPLPIRDLIEQSEQLFGLPSYIVVGALSERTGSLEPSEAQAIIEAWAGHAVPGPGGGGGGTAFLGTVRAPVLTDAALPPSGNNLGDMRLVITGMVLHGWDGASWVPISGGGGGGPTPDFIDVTALMTGVQAGDTVVWSGTNSRFQPGALTPE